MIRTRFAPSPTGYLHVGGLRTALYNYLYAHKHNGTFILRIEDTDKERFVEGATENLINTLKRVGLDFDEGPYIQSERLEHYKKFIQELLDKGVAYKCYCTPERLEEMRNKQSQAKQAPMYDRKCLNEPERNEAFVIRQKIPHDQKVKFKDHIRGFVKFDGSTIDDQVLMKSDGFPTYHLANVVDDHLMEITHVIRGEEWLPSTPKHVLLYEAFGWKQPEFAHIPLLLNKDKSKLSKRQGNVSVEYYLDEGYIKEAIINFIALLGWHPGKGEEKEIFSLEELIDVFSLEQVHKGGAIFDEEKLQWFNFKWQKSLHHQKLAEIAKKLGGTMELNQRKEPVYSFSNLDNEKSFVLERAQLLLTLCKYHIPKEWLKEKVFLSRALITIEEKILKNPKEAEELLKFYFEIGDYDKALIQHEKMKVDEQIAKKSLEESLNALKDFDHFDNLNAIQEHLLSLVKKLELKNGQVLWPLRVALSGEQYSPGTFELFWVLGKEESLKRIKIALKKL